LNQASLPSLRTLSFTAPNMIEMFAIGRRFVFRRSKRAGPLLDPLSDPLVKILLCRVKILLGFDLFAFSCRFLPRRSTPAPPPIGMGRPDREIVCYIGAFFLALSFSSLSEISYGTHSSRHILDERFFFICLPHNEHPPHGLRRLRFLIGKIYLKALPFVFPLNLEPSVDRRSLS